MTEDSSALKHFFAGYYHQDWMVEVKDPIGVVDLYVVQNPVPEQLFELAAAIRRLVDATATDAELASHLQELGSYYLPADELAIRNWLHAVERRLIEAAASLRAQTKPR